MRKLAEGIMVSNVIDEFERHMDVVWAERYILRNEIKREAHPWRGWFRRLVGGVWQ